MHRKAFYLLLSLSFWEVPFWAFFLFPFMTVESYEWRTFSDEMNSDINEIVFSICVPIFLLDTLYGRSETEYHMNCHHNHHSIWFQKKDSFCHFHLKMVMQNIIYFPYELSLIKLKGNYILSRIRCEVTRIWK